jgi:DNA-binding transcriptional LysR family regulator
VEAADRQSIQPGSGVDGSARRLHPDKLLALPSLSLKGLGGVIQALSLKGNAYDPINRSMNLINLSPGDLEAFLNVAKGGSFRAAAISLGLSQPAVSARVQHLEAVLGVRLFHRTTRRVAITEAGERLRQRVDGMVDGLRELVREFRDEAHLRRGRLTLGASPSVAASFLPDAIGVFCARWPLVEFMLHDDFFGRVLDRLTRGEVDMAVLPFAPEQDGLRFEPLMTDDYVVALASSHPLAATESLTIEQVAALPLISLPPQSATWMTLRRHFESAGLDFRPIVLTRNALTALAMVRAGLGVALVTQLLLTAMNMAGLVTRPISGMTLTRQIGIVTDAARSPSPAVCAMSALLHEMLR